MSGIVRKIIRSRAEKAEREGGRSATLFSLRSVFFTGPIFVFIAGLIALMPNPTWRSDCCLLALGCLLYLGIDWIWYSRVCRIASVQLAGATGTTLVSLLSLLGVLNPFVEAGFFAHLIPRASLTLGYVAVWAFASYQARRGLRTFLASPLAGRCLDLENGIYDLALATRPSRDFIIGRPTEDVSGPTEPRTRTWWVLAVGALVTPICALLVALSDALTRPRGSESLLCGYVLALGAGFFARRGWLNYWWYRTWEWENGRPLLIKYLEDRYRGDAVLRR